MQVVDKPYNYALSQNTKNHIVTKSAEGLPQTLIAKDLDISQSAVSKHLAKPESKQLTEKLQKRLQEKHTTRFIARTIKEEQEASKLSNYNLGLSDDNNSKFIEPEEIEKFLVRMDKKGIAIAKGVRILDTNTIHIGDDNSQTVVVTESYQKFLDFQNSQPLDGEVIDIHDANGEDVSNND